MIEGNPGLLEAIKVYNAARSEDERALIYGRLLQSSFNDETVYEAANSVGTLSGTLVTQRALDLLVSTFPVLTAIAVDYSSEDSYLGQQVMGRVVVPPAATDYSEETGYTNSPATTVDIPITINVHKSVSVSFNANELGGTSRKLFQEQSEAMMVALGNNLSAALFNLITPANFPNSTSSDLGNFGRSKMATLAKALDTRKVPRTRRFCLLNLDFHSILGQDGSIIQLAVHQKPEIITEGTLPPVAGLKPYEVTDMPTADNLVGFAAHPMALAIAVRPAGDYGAVIPGSMNGRIETVKEPRTGLACSVVAFVNHQMGAATMRVAWFYGVAKGNADAGQRLVLP